VDSPPRARRTRRHRAGRMGEEGVEAASCRLVGNEAKRLEAASTFGIPQTDMEPPKTRVGTGKGGSGILPLGGELGKAAGSRFYVWNRANRHGSARRPRRNGQGWKRHPAAWWGMGAKRLEAASTFGIPQTGMEPPKTRVGTGNVEAASCRLVGNGGKAAGSRCYVWNPANRHGAIPRPRRNGQCRSGILPLGGEWGSAQDRRGGGSPRRSRRPRRRVTRSGFTTEGTENPEAPRWGGESREGRAGGAGAPACGSWHRGRLDVGDPGSRAPGAHPTPDSQLHLPTPPAAHLSTAAAGGDLLSARVLGSRCGGCSKRSSPRPKPGSSWMRWRFRGHRSPPRGCGVLPSPH
jgi:hypothetical protein